MPEPVSDDARLAAEIDRLKAEFPKTRELYREACALLFFRFGITPTANRLYQLVHRGSMSTPTAVLSEFWADLREKSRVRIEHPDLPAEVTQAAGELVAALWSRATAAANAALDALRAEVEAQQQDARQSVAALQADLARTETALEQRTSALLTAQVRIHDLEQSLAAAEAARTALDAELAQLRQASRDRETTRTRTQAALTSERDRLRADLELADTHRQASEKHTTLEIERERATTC
jgi:chromosome segregation ATPase